MMDFKYWVLNGIDSHDAVEATKLENKRGWKAEENFERRIIKTIEWNLEKYNVM